MKRMSGCLSLLVAVGCSSGGGAVGAGADQGGGEAGLAPGSERRGLASDAKPRFQVWSFAHMEEERRQRARRARERGRETVDATDPSAVSSFSLGRRGGRKGGDGDVQFTTLPDDGGDVFLAKGRNMVLGSVGDLDSCANSSAPKNVLGVHKWLKAVGWRLDKVAKVQEGHCYLVYWEPGRELSKVGMFYVEELDEGRRAVLGEAGVTAVYDSD